MVHVDSDDFKKSNENMNPGLYYGSTYYEDEPIYNDALDPPQESILNKITTVSDIPPIKIEDNLVTNIELPPIVWHGFDVIPKILNVTNTGQTILINGQWPNGKPYIEGGPLNGTYIFSQIHFHSPSEHEVAGKRYPLEMHVVHYKTSYLTQERAMHEKDGTVVLVYLFEVLGTCPSSSLSSVTKLAPQIEKVNSKTETTNVPLDQIVQPFTSNYYVYWGSVSTEKNSYLLQWIINGCILFVTNEEAEDLLGIMNFDECNTKHLTRMKPQNDKIFYIKELVNEDKDLNNENVLQNVSAEYNAEITECKEESQASKCHTGVQSDIDGFAVIKYLLGEMGEMCGAKCKCKATKSYSGLRRNICCQKKEGKSVKSKTNTCITPTDLPSQKSVVCIEERNSEEACVEVQEIPSRPVCTASRSLSNGEAVELCECSEPVNSVGNEDEDCKPHVVVKFPSRRKIREKCYKRKKNKSTESSKVETTVSSSGSESSVKEKKKKKKRGKSKETPPEKKKKVTECVKKLKKKMKKKKSCESDETKVMSGSKSSKESVKTAFAVDAPLECRVATVTENNYEAALTDFSFKDLEDSDCLTVDQMTMESLSDSKCKDVLSTLKSSFRSDYSSFTTLYEKRRNIKAPDISHENCSINVILPPVNMRQNTSSFLLNQKTESEEGKFFPNSITNDCAEISKLNVRQITCSGVKESETSTNGKKEFCVHVDVLFRSKNGEASKCLAQEYNLTLIYNQNILQEYRGILHPSVLEVGNYEKLELLPKYPELDNINIELQDCTVKMESLDEISMRAKFLLKEISIKEDKMLTDCPAISDKIVTFNDAETQYCTIETDKPEDNTVVDSKVTENLEKKQSSCIKRERSHSQTVLNTDPEPLTNKTPSVHSVLQNTDSGNVESKAESVNKSDVVLGESKKTTSNSVEPCTDSVKEERLHKHLTKESHKKLNEAPPHKKKTVYFMYDKIEKDKNSGKNIFVGSFRSKDDMQKFLNEENLKSSEHSNEGKEDKLLLLAKNTTEGLSFHSSVGKVEYKIVSPYSSRDSCKKDTITLHKSRSKTVRTCSSKKERLNLVVSKVMKLENESCRRLANLVGKDKKRNQKLIFYELKKHVEKSASKDNDPCTSATNDNSPCTSATTTKFASELSDRSLPSENSECKWFKICKSKKHVPTTVKPKGNADISKHRSKSAVIVIPVEVDSLSKIEVILVEHNDPFRRGLRKSEKGIIPCLNYGDRSSSA